MTTTLNLARFTINGTPSEDGDGDRGYDANPLDELKFTLERNPATGVNSVTYYWPVEDDGETPFASLGAVQQVFDDNSDPEYSPPSVNDIATTTANGSTTMSTYVVRCKVTTDTGDHYFERMIVFRKSGLRKIVPAERQEYDHRGWADALNEIAQLTADGGIIGSVVTSISTGLVAAFPGTGNYFFTSDGSTAGGVWSKLTAAIANGMIDDRAIPWTKLLGVGTTLLEPTGWEVDGAPDLLLSYDYSTKTLSVETSGSDISYFDQGTHRTLTDYTIKYSVWSSTTGFHWFYMHNNTLYHTTDEATWLGVLNGNGVGIASLYWNNYTNCVVAFCDERHGMMPGTTHRWAHRGIGALLVSGGELSGFTIGDGSSDSHAECDFGDVTIEDEDLVITQATGGIYAQQMSPGEFYLYFLDSMGAGDWRRREASTYSTMFSGATYDGSCIYTGANGRCAYNLVVAGSGSLVEIGEGEYVNSYVFATPEISGNTSATNWVIGAILGRGHYTTVAEARNAILNEVKAIVADELPFQEIVWLGAIISQSSAAYSNSSKSRVVQSQETDGTMVDYVDLRMVHGFPVSCYSIPVTGVTDHGLLGGLGDDDHPQYMLRSDLAAEELLLDQMDFWADLTTRASCKVTHTLIGPNLNYTGGASPYYWSLLAMAVGTAGLGLYTWTTTTGGTINRYEETISGSIPDYGARQHGYFTIEAEFLAGAHHWVCISNGNNHGRTWFDFQNGVLGTTQGSEVIDATITAMTYGYYRCRVHFYGVFYSCRLIPSDGDTDLNSTYNASTSMTVKNFKFTQHFVNRIDNQGKKKNLLLVQPDITMVPCTFDPVGYAWDLSAGILFQMYSVVRYLEFYDNDGAKELLSKLSDANCPWALWVVMARRGSVVANRWVFLSYGATGHYAGAQLNGTYWQVSKKESTIAAATTIAVTAAADNTMALYAGYFTGRAIYACVGVPGGALSYDYFPADIVPITDVHFGGSDKTTYMGAGSHSMATIYGVYLKVGGTAITPGDSTDLLVRALIAAKYGITC